MGPIDLDNPEINLVVELEREPRGTTTLDQYLESCQQWHENFEEKGGQIIQDNLNLLHHIQSGVDKFVSIVNQNVGLIDEVHTQVKNLQAMKSIKGQRYHMLVEVYVAEQLDKLDGQIKKILAGNKIMEGLHAKIQRIKDQT